MSGWRDVGTWCGCRQYSIGIGRRAADSHLFVCFWSARRRPRAGPSAARSGLRRSTHGYVMNSFYILQVNEKAAATDNRPAVQTVDRLIPFYIYTRSQSIALDKTARPSTADTAERTASAHGGVTLGHGCACRGARARASSGGRTAEQSAIGCSLLSALVARGLLRA